MNKITINGKTYNVEGNNINIINNTVYVDGKPIQEGLSGVVEIRFEGDLANLKADGSVTVNGNVQKDLNAGGSVTCGSVFNSVSAGGSVSCHEVLGSVSAGGSISYRR